MTKSTIVPLLLVLLATSAPAAPAPSDQPRVQNVRLERLGETDDLEATLARLGSSATEPVWVGYSVRRVEGRRRICCGGSCHLEDDGGHYYERDDGDELREESPRLMILLRLEGGKINRIRTYSTDCELDADGRRVYWLSEVQIGQSLALHERLAREQPPQASDAVRAIAHHDGDEADARLEALASSRLPDDTREKAVFWMGAARRQKSFEALSRLAESTQDAFLREKIVFALHLSPVPESTAKLIQMAREDRDSEIREKAIFWLGQQAGKEAAAAIREAVEEDPDLEVKKKAIFALSQLPKDEGVPLLIEMAETHPQPEIRKKAIFWLGQSGDPRALAFFEEILLRR